MNRILQCLATRAAMQPDDIAFAGSETLTYQQCWQQVQSVAQQLSALSPRCIALRAENSVQWAVLDLAAMLAQIPFVPVAPFFTDQQVEHTLQSCGADLLFGEWAAEIATVTNETIAGFNVCRALGDYQPAELLPGTIKVTFTSGSTGHPKGVCLSEQNLESVSDSLAVQVKTALQGDSSHLSLIPLAALLENVTAVYVPILLGKRSIVLSGESIGLSGSSQFDPQQFIHALIRYQPASLVTTPALLMALIQLVDSVPAIALSLRFVAVGGARVSAELIQRAHQKSLPVFEGYGLSECASVVSLNTPLAHQPGSAGKVLPHLTIKLTDDSDILVKGNVALGYIGEPFTDEWLATGDIGTVDQQGFLTVTGRRKHQLITAFGRNVSPEWIEVEAQIYPELHRMIVIGDGELQLSAVVISQQPEPAMLAAQQLNSVLPDYARLDKIYLVETDSEMLQTCFTPNGKPLRHQISQWINTNEHTGMARSYPL
ncbi:AMP-binding protein [Vibrio sp. CAIM 722]|uniref:AMP-binding protein n=1 Tax=Vibrio eleionomae TaxID=2653505 RepID=A0A7X4RU75_9VIBR|nr:AMP-binding protein [Vibrio eleionomae]MZI92947.1 AMP-binding protein [Vibrio eleionomae]